MSLWSRMGRLLVSLLLCGCGAMPGSSGDTPGGAQAAGSRTVRLGKLPNKPAIVFTSMRWQRPRSNPANWELYVMDEDGKNATRITYENRPYDHAAVSPDHRLIAATTREKSLLGRVRLWLWVYDLLKGTETPLLEEFYTAGMGGVDWSPDGLIYFAGSPSVGEGTDVYRVYPDGTGLTRLSETEEMESDVSVSQDGTFVAFVRVARVSGKRKPQIWMMSTDGSGQRMVHDGGPELGRQGNYPIGSFDPEFSPDNEWIVFSTTNTKGDNFGLGAHDICKVRTDGTGFHVLTPGVGAVQMIPDWIGNRLLFTEFNERDGYVGIVTMDPNGQDRTRLEQGLGDIWDGGRHGRWIPPRDPNWPYVPRDRER